MKPKPVPTRIYRGTPRNLRLLAGRLRAGEPVAVPTETVYGLAGNALDPAACAAIYRAKGRPANDPLIVHVHTQAQAERVARFNPAAQALAGAFWPGPLTLILPRQAVVPDIVTAGLASVAVRMPAHPLFRRLLRQCDLPLAAPSANPFGYISPTTAEHVRQGLGGRIRSILDGGPSRIGLESTIVDVRHPARVRVLRPGAITAAEIESVLGRRLGRTARRTASAQRAQLAPGLLTRHYSPRTRLVLHDRLDAGVAPASSVRVAWLHFRRPAGKAGPHVHWLDARGDQARAARRLFAMLRRLDARGYAEIHAEWAPAGSRAEAINDRLRRAAAR